MTLLINFFRNVYETIRGENSSRNPGVFHHVKTRAIKIKDRVSNLFKHSPKEDESKQTERVSTLFESFKQELTLNESKELLAANIDLYIRERGKAFWTEGMIDGAYGQKNSKMHFVAMKDVQSIQGQVRALCKGKLKGYKRNKKIFKTQMEFVDSEMQTEGIYQDRFRDLSRQKPKYFSLSLGVIYIVIAMFLILADVTINLELTKEGFGYDSPISFSELFEHPWRVISSNWEVILFSLGVAFCAIYIKIYYDEFVGNPMGEYVTQFKKIPDIENNKEINIVKIDYWLKVLIKTSILGFCIYTIRLLGVFRFNAILHYDPSRFPAAIQELTKSTFVSITLIFPIVSGICFSLGLQIFHSRSIKRKVERAFKQLKKEKLNLLKNYKINNEKYHDLNGYVESWRTGQSIGEHYIQFLLACYVQGYQRGLLKPEEQTGNDLFEITELMRKKVISRRIFNRIHLENKGSDDLTNTGIVIPT